MFIYIYVGILNTGEVANLFNSEETGAMMESLSKVRFNKVVRIYMCVYMNT
jgi:hypothetical protein